jgi:hypothetical protein
MQVQAPSEERRKFLSVRKLVDDAKKQKRPLHHAVLVWGARQLAPDSLGILDEAIAGRETGYEKTEAICRRQHLSDAFNLSTPAEQLALWWFAQKLGPKKLDELDRKIGSNEILLFASAAQAPKGAAAGPQDIKVTWVPESGPPRQARRLH